MSLCCKYLFSVFQKFLPHHAGQFVVHLWLYRAVSAFKLFCVVPLFFDIFIKRAYPSRGNSGVDRVVRNVFRYQASGADDHIAAYPGVIHYPCAGADEHIVHHLDAAHPLGKLFVRILIVEHVMNDVVSDEAHVGRDPHVVVQKYQVRIQRQLAVLDKANDKILVTKYNGRVTSYYALVAGFTEIGETLEQTVEREVMEEVGLKVKNITYYKSQPWGVADDILAGFYCEVDGSIDIHRDEEELSVAEWKTREEVELQPDDLSLTNEMMKMFKEGKV